MKYISKHIVFQLFNFLFFDKKEDRKFDDEYNLCQITELNLNLQAAYEAIMEPTPSPSVSTEYITAAGYGEITSIQHPYEEL